MNANEECLLAMLILMLVILMLTLMLPNLNTGYADTDADSYIRITLYVLVLYKYNYNIGSKVGPNTFLAWLQKLVWPQFWHLKKCLVSNLKIFFAFQTLHCLHWPFSNWFTLNNLKHYFTNMHLSNIGAGDTLPWNLLVFNRIFMYSSFVFQKH